MNLMMNSMIRTIFFLQMISPESTSMIIHLLKALMVINVLRYTSLCCGDTEIIHVPSSEKTNRLKIKILTLCKGNLFLNLCSVFLF